MIDHQRMNQLSIQQLREFVLSGVCLEDDQTETGTFDERAKNAYDALLHTLDHLLLHHDQYDQIRETIYRYAGTVRDIYFEMGILNGARLMNDLLSDTGSFNRSQAETEAS